MGALVGDNSPDITELSGAIEMVARVKEVVQDDANALKHCAIVLGYATENEHLNAGCK